MSAEDDRGGAQAVNKTDLSNSSNSSSHHRPHTLNRPHPCISSSLTAPSLHFCAHPMQPYIWLFGSFCGGWIGGERKAGRSNCVWKSSPLYGESPWFCIFVESGLRGDSMQGMHLEPYRIGGGEYCTAVKLVIYKKHCDCSRRRRSYAVLWPLGFCEMVYKGRMETVAVWDLVEEIVSQ